MGKLLLLDAYALIYRAYYAFIRAPRYNSKQENTSAVFGFLNTLEELLTKENPDYVAVAFDPKGGTFRHHIYPQYKAQREETPEAIRYAVPKIKDLLAAYNISVLEVPGFEADDVIGTLAWRFASDNVTVYMVTPDKDYGQLVRPNVRMLRPGNGGKPQELLDEQAVCAKYGIDRTEQVIDLLGLMGDASDNVPGCPGVGEKTAVKLIKEHGSIEELLLHTDRLKGALKQKIEDHAEQIRFSKMLVTIRTDVPIDITLEQLRRKPKDYPTLLKLIGELEFKSIAQRLAQEAGISAPHSPTPPAKTGNNGNFVGDLFAQVNETATHLEQPAKKGQTSTRETTLFSAEEWEAAKESILSEAKTVPHKYYLVENEDDVKEFCAKILYEKIVAIDTETTSLDAIDAELVGMSFATKAHEAFYVPVPPQREAAQRIVELLRPIYESETSLKVGQNIKYDMMVLANYGVEVRGPLFDTMLAHYVLEPRQVHNMDYLAEVYLKYRTIHIDELIGPKGKAQKSMRDLAPGDVKEYAAEDADVTLQLYHVLNAAINTRGFSRLFYEVEMPLVPVLVEMERNGMRIDTQALDQVSEELTAKMNAIEQEIQQLVGETFNIGSPKQVGTILFDKLRVVDKPRKTKTGLYDTSEQVLQNLRSKHPVIGMILDYRGYKKLLSTYTQNLPRLINPRTQRIHTTFNQAITATGRLSSSNPNLQNIPIRDDNGREVRRAFIPDDGCLFLSADYSQIELRIMAHLSQDPNLLHAFREGQDIHQATAAKIFKKQLDQVTKDERRKAKTANFGIIYGISSFGLAERLEVSRTEAKNLIDGYFATYPQVKAYMDQSIAFARENGYARTLFGRQCTLPDINSRNAVVRGYAERNAINTPIQGTAADIMKLAMSAVLRRMKAEGLRSKLIMQVHDELNFSVLPEEREQLERLVVECMEGACQLAIPLIVECGWGNNWLEAH